MDRMIGRFAIWILAAVTDDRMPSRAALLGAVRWIDSTLLLCVALLRAPPGRPRDAVSGASISTDTLADRVAEAVARAELRETKCWLERT
jgi:hypothetical protein